MDSTIFCHQVQADWVDYNGHMRDAYYALVFSLACDTLMGGPLGLDAAARQARQRTLYTLELHVQFLHEMKLGSDLHVTWQLAAYDHKRMHVVMQLWRADEVMAASCEMLLICIDTHTGRSCAWDAPLAACLAQALVTHPVPAATPIGRSITLPNVQARTDSS